MKHQAPIPANEAERLLQLAAYDLDYLSLKEDFSSLAQLAATVTGTRMSHINLIDAYTQWTIGDHGLAGDITAREDTVCHYTILQNAPFEVKDLSADDRFNEKDFVTKDPHLRYYYGVPLQSNGLNIGSLCVLDQEEKQMPPEKGELLNLIALEVVKRLRARRVLDDMVARLAESRNTQKKMAHDIRGPLGGVRGLADLIVEEGQNNNMEEVLEYAGLMSKSCDSMLDLADEILQEEESEAPSTALTLADFGSKLEQLYSPQAKNKKLTFTVITAHGIGDFEVLRGKLFQIGGNLICNAIKFTPAGGSVKVNLEMPPDGERLLRIRVSDSGVGMERETVEALLNGHAVSTSGTGGEQGFGFGLNLIKHLVKELHGTFHVSSNPGSGSVFEVVVPVIIDKL